MLTPLVKRQEILAAFDGSGMSAARFAAMVGINYSTFCSWVQEHNKKQGKDPLLTEAASKPRCTGDGMEIKLLGGGARLRIRDERDAELAAVVLRAMGGGAC